MAELEMIQGKDIGYEAIKKLDRNIKAVNAELEDNDLEDLAEQIKVCSEGIEENERQIGDLSDTTVRTKVNTTHLYTTTLEWGKANPNCITTYAGNGYTDLPPGFSSGWWGDMWSITGSGTTVYIKENQGEKIWYRVITPSGNWAGNWKLLATTDKIDISYTLNNGLTHRAVEHSKGWYTDTVGNLAIMWNTNGVNVFDWGMVYCTLPPQLRPKQQINDVLIMTSQGVMSLTIFPNGNVTRGNISPPTLPEWMTGFIGGYIRG